VGTLTGLHVHAAFLSVVQLQTTHTCVSTHSVNGPLARALSDVSGKLGLLLKCRVFMDNLNTELVRLY